MNWITPKTNFTKEDYYNYTDFNRIENNTEVLRKYLVELDYKIPILNITKYRNNRFVDFVSSINRIENNIEIIKKIFIAPPWYSTKVWEPGVGFSFMDANRIERNLEQLMNYAKRTEESFIYCGTINCGQGGNL